MQDNGLVQDPAVAEMANCNDQPPPTVSVVQIELACIRTSAAMTASGMCPEPTSIKVRYFIKRSRHAGNRIWTSFRAARWSKPHEGVEASPSRDDEDSANSSYSVWAIWQPFFRKFYSKAWSLRWRGPSGRQARLGRTICRLHAVFLVRLPIVATQPAPRRPSALPGQSLPRLRVTPGAALIGRKRARGSPARQRCRWCAAPHRRRTGPTSRGTRAQARRPDEPG